MEGALKAFQGGIEDIGDMGRGLASRSRARGRAGYLGRPRFLAEIRGIRVMGDMGRGEGIMQVYEEGIEVKSLA